MLYHNDNDSHRIPQALTAMHKYISYYDDEVDRVYTSQGLLANQLSVERGINPLFQLANGFPPEQRLEGFHLHITDKHAGNNFFNVHDVLFSFQLGQQVDTH